MWRGGSCSQARWLERSGGTGTGQALAGTTHVLQRVPPAFTKQPRVGVAPMASAWLSEWPWRCCDAPFTLHPVVLEDGDARTGICLPLLSVPPQHPYTQHHPRSTSPPHHPRLISIVSAAQRQHNQNSSLAATPPGSQRHDATRHVRPVPGLAVQGRAR